MCPPALRLDQCQLPPTLPNYLPLWAKIKAGSSFVIVPTFLPGALRCKGRDWVSFLLSKYFDPVSHIMHQSPQAQIKQVSAVSAPGLFSPFSMDLRYWQLTRLLWMPGIKIFPGKLQALRLLRAWPCVLAADLGHCITLHHLWHVI